METEFFQEFLAQKTLSVRIIPGAKKTEIAERMQDGTWKIRISSPPVDGKANTELLKFLKKKGSIRAEVISGEKDRNKVLRIISSERKS